MARDGKFGIVLDEARRLLPNEPVFIIRGKDAVAPAAIRAYAKESALRGASPEHVAECQQVAEEIEAWQANNPALVKVPD